ncbi:hypothetical protein [Myroides sp. LJL119]
MRKSILLILLLSFLYQNTSSFWIITWFYIDRDYIAQNVCVNRFQADSTCKGSCYLKSELTAESDKKPDLPNLTIKQTQPLFYQNITSLTSDNLPSYFKVIYPKYLDAFFKDNLIFGVFEPPENLVTPLRLIS